jgi:hypothetical protein
MKKKCPRTHTIRLQREKEGFGVTPLHVEIQNNNKQNEMQSRSRSTWRNKSGAVENCFVLFSMGIEDADEAIQQRK